MSICARKKAKIVKQKNALKRRAEKRENRFLKPGMFSRMLFKKSDEPMESHSVLLRAPAEKPSLFRTPAAATHWRRSFFSPSLGSFPLRPPAIIGHFRIPGLSAPAILQIMKRSGLRAPFRIGIEHRVVIPLNVDTAMIAVLHQNGNQIAPVAVPKAGGTIPDEPFR